MKKAKEKFDNLIQRIRSGEQVSFGEMEKAFAEGFLHKFLKRLTSGSEIERTQKLYKDHLADEDQEYDEDDEGNVLDQGQLTHYELEIARIVVGTLGVRPRREELSDYVDRSLRNQDWSLLDKVLSLTEEGSLGEGTVQRLALECIVEGRDSSYAELVKQFGEMQFNPEQVVAVYQRELGEKRFEVVKNLRNETKVALPAELAQQSYERFLDQGDIGALVAVKDISRVQPNLTTEMHSDLEKLFSASKLSEQDISNLDNLFGVLSEARLRRNLQLRALQNKESIETFCNLYKLTKFPIDQDEIKITYDRIAEEGRTGDLHGLMMSTGVPGSKRVTSVLYNGFIATGRLGDLRSLFARTSVAPQYDVQILTNTLENIKRSSGDYARAVTNFLGAVQLADRIRKDDAHTIGRKILEDSLAQNSWKGVTEAVGAFFAKYKLQEPDDVVPLHIYCAARELSESVKEAERTYAKTNGRRYSPLEVVKGVNTSLYNKFRGNVGKTVREYTGRAKKIRKKKENIVVSDHPLVQEAYKRCLEVALVETQQEGESTLPLAELQTALSVPISPKTTREALDSFIERNYHEADVASARVIGMSNSDLVFNLTDDTVEDMIAKYESKGDIERAKKIALLCKVTGKKTFSDSVKPVIARVAANIVDNFVLYDSFTSVEGLKPEFSAEDSLKIRDTALSALRKGEFDHYDGIISRSGINVEASPAEAREVIDAYFKKRTYETKPSEISRRLGLPLDSKQIQARYRDLFESENRLDIVMALKEDTGINPDQVLIRKEVERRKSNLSFLEMACREFGFRYSPEDVGRIYERLMPHIGDRFSDEIKCVPAHYMHTLIRTHDTQPDETKSKQIIERAVKNTLLVYYPGSCIELPGEVRIYRSSQEREAIESLAKTLVHKYGIRVQDGAVQNLVKMPLESPGQKNNYLIDALHTLETVYRRGDILSEEDAKRAVSFIDNEFRINVRDQNRRGTFIRDVSYAYQRADAQKEAAQLAAKLFSDRNTFAGWAYCTITGAKPDMTREQLVKLREDFRESNRTSSLAYVFENTQRDHYAKMLDSWLEAS